VLSYVWITTVLMPLSRGAAVTQVTNFILPLELVAMLRHGAMAALKEITLKFRTLVELLHFPLFMP
jgi:hypothetical protein